MSEKIILVVILVIGALITFLAEPIGQVVRMAKSPDKNLIIIKIIGFIIVILAYVITFVKF